MAKLTEKINFHHFPPSVRALLAGAVRQTLLTADPSAVSAGCDINFILVSDQEIKRLNRRFRRVNRITDVISFSYSTVPLSGDIYIARTRSLKQARREGHAWDKELSYLAIHGVLHLFGYTDYTPRARHRMFLLQDKIFLCLFS
jgi:probable rRNA maturation factor